MAQRIEYSSGLKKVVESLCRESNSESNAYHAFALPLSHRGIHTPQQVSEVCKEHRAKEDECIKSKLNILKCLFYPAPAFPGTSGSH